MISDIAQRMEEYESAYDLKIMRRVPVIVRVSCKSFNKLCKDCSKPYDLHMVELMAKTMLATVMQISDAVFGYCYRDEIIFILRNDQTLDFSCWHDNRLQKLNSTITSLVTCAFNKLISVEGIYLAGDAIFETNVNPLPSIQECINNLIWRQNRCMLLSINDCAEYELGKKHSSLNVFETLKDLSIPDRIDLLYNETGIIFEEEYPSSFRLGVSAYKALAIHNNKDGEEILSHKWKLDWYTPSFASERAIIYRILSSGKDILREAEI